VTREPGGDRDDEEGVQSSAPSGPVSLFDFLETQIPAKTPAAAAQCSKPETKTVDKEKPRTENYSMGGEKNPRDNNKDSRGGKRDFDSKGKFSTGQPSASRNDDKKKEVERKDNSDRRRDDSRKKGDNKKNDNRGGDRNSQPKEFAPVFHGKSADKNPEKLDKFERALLAEEAKNRSNKTETQKKPQQSRENSRTDLNNKQQNGYQYYDGRIQGKGGNDQDFGQWNGNNRGQRQPSNLGREDSLANGMQSMNIGGKERQQRGGFQGQSQRAHNRGRADQQQPLGSADGGQRGRGGCQGHQRPVWQEGQRCMAKYWEDEQFYQATITGMSPTTAVVHFQAYGNYEEVLLGDLRPFQGGGHQQGGRGGRHQGGYHQGGHHRGREIAPTPGLPPAFRH